MNLQSSATNGVCEGFCVIKSCEKKVNRNGAFYLDMVIADAGGEMNAKLWDYSPERHGNYSADSVVKVRGTVETWNSQNQFKIERIRHAGDSDNAVLAELVPSSPFAAKDMLDEIYGTVDGFQDEHYKSIVKAVLQNNEQAISVCSAAVRMHHAVNGGLLFHTVAVMRAAKAICSVYPFLNKDLLLAGVILHDIEKINELHYGETGLASGYTVKGNLIGHLIGGVAYLEKTAEALGGFPEEKRLALQHILLSHHGTAEFGSPIPPMFPEAAVVSALDNLDAHLYEMCEAVKDLEVGEMTQNRVFGLDRKLYKLSADYNYRLSK